MPKFCDCDCIKTFQNHQILAFIYYSPTSTIIRMTDGAPKVRKNSRKNNQFKEDVRFNSSGCYRSGIAEGEASVFLSFFIKNSRVFPRIAVLPLVVKVVSIEITVFLQF